MAPRVQIRGSAAVDFTSTPRRCRLRGTTNQPPPFVFDVIASTGYELVYDAARLPFPGWPVAVIGLAVAAAGVGFGAYLRRCGVASQSMRTIATSAVIFGASWALFVGGGLYAQHSQLRSALREGSFVPVEGLVHDRPSGAATDANGASWVVESGETAHWYRYDRSLLSVGYRRAAPATGGIRDGSRVRVADIGGRIARLEVMR